MFFYASYFRKEINTESKHQKVFYVEFVSLINQGKNRGGDPVFARIGSGALYLEQREIFLYKFYWMNNLDNFKIIFFVFILFQMS